MDSASYSEELNAFLVEAFNDILKTEELAVTEQYPELSIREVHVIEAVCRAVDQGGDNRASAIAATLRVTAGTLTTSVNQLEAKGYLERVRDRNDKRSVRLRPTEKGREAERRHREFHQEMVADVVARLSPEETEILVRGLGSITAFFRDKYRI